MDIFIEQQTMLESLRSGGFSIYVAGFDEGAYTPETVPVDKPIALVMGTELSGVSDIARDLSDGTVMIPMSGFTQSFNVSVATACLLYRITEEEKSQGGEIFQKNKKTFFSLGSIRENKKQTDCRNG